MCNVVQVPALHIILVPTLSISTLCSGFCTILLPLRMFLAVGTYKTPFNVSMAPHLLRSTTSSLLCNGYTVPSATVIICFVGQRLSMYLSFFVMCAIAPVVSRPFRWGHSYNHRNRVRFCFSATFLAFGFRGLYSRLDTIFNHVSLRVKYPGW
jgi:hypothetical protein